MRAILSTTVQRFSLLSITLLVLPLGLEQTARAQVNDSTTGADIFPATTAFYVQLDNGGKLLDAVLEHPLRSRLEQLDEYKKAMRSPQMIAVQMGVALIEGQLEQKWQDAIKNVTDNVYLCIDPATDGVAILLRANDEAKLKRTAGTLLGWVKSEVEKQGNDPPEVKEYRDAKVADFNGNAIMARWKNWLLLSNKKQLAKTIADNLMDHDGSITDRLSGQDWFAAARKLNQNHQLWATVHLKQIRNSGIAREMFEGRPNNPAAELILGGIFDGLKDAEFAAIGADLDRNIKLSAVVPFDQQSANKSRSFFYGPDFEGRAPKPLIPRNMIANLISYRDIGEWWLSKEELYEENVIAQLTQADSQLSTFFGNANFGQDVLGAVKPGVQIVVSEQKLPESYSPDIRLPSFAFVGQLKDPAKGQRRFKMAFQSFIGLANFNLGQQGQPQLELETIKDGDTVFSSAQYLMEDENDKGLLIYNFSPTIGFQDDYFIVSSTKTLATELAELAKQNGGATRDTNTRLEVFAGPIKNALQDNSDSLIARGMIEDGLDREQAEQQVKILLAVVEMLNQGQLDLQVKQDQIRLDFDLQFNSGN